MAARPFDPKPLLQILKKHEVEYVLIGGLAGMAHGSSLPSYDLDVVYARDEANLERLAEALREMGASLRGAPEDVPFLLDAFTLKAGLNFTFETRLGAFDIVGEPEGAPPYELLRADAVQVEFAGEEIRVASLDHLIAMKRAAGRAKDEPHLSEYVALAEEQSLQGSARGVGSRRRKET